MNNYKNKVKNIMYMITLPLVAIALVSLIVYVIIFLIKGYNQNTVTIFGIIIGICVLLSLVTYIILNPISKRIDKKNYEDLISLDFSNVDLSKSNKIYPVIGFNELCHVQEDGLFFKQIKKLVKYSDVTISILQRKFYGQVDNYFKIKIDNKKYKNFPKYVYLDYMKEIMALFSKYNVEVKELDNLKITKTKTKEEPLKTYRYPLKYLIIKIVLTVCLIVAGTLSIIFSESDFLGYVFYFPIVLIWINNSKSGKLVLTENSVYNVKNFVKVVIQYDEIININIDEKSLKISSPFTFIEFDNNEQIIEDIKRHIK